jgi:hypothetical protein
MDLLGMIGELREEWERINAAITALERVARGNRPARGRPPKPRPAQVSERPFGAGEPLGTGGVRRRVKPKDSAARERELPHNEHS